MGCAGGISRRDFLTRAFRGRPLALAAVGGLVWGHVLSKSRGAQASLRPPGARAEADYLATCIKCGQCVEACPFGTLSLATLEQDRATGVPHFEPRETPCYMCEDTPCIAACPTDALVENTPIDEARMGLAVLIDQETCLAFQGLRCEVCYRACPLIEEAIRLEYRPIERTGKHACFLPVVDSDHCTGCGKCEHACVLEEAAIKVLPRQLAQGRLGAHYRFEWQDDEVPVPQTSPEMPAWSEGMDGVLESMNDLSGIDER